MKLFLTLLLWILSLAAAPPASADPDWQHAYRASYSNHYASFQPPKVGSRVSFYLRIGGKQDGVLQDLTPTSLVVSVNGQTRTFAMAAIAPESLATLSRHAFAKDKAQVEVKREKEEYEQARRSNATSMTYIARNTTIPTDSFILVSAESKNTTIAPQSNKTTIDSSPKPQTAINPAKPDRHQSGSCGTGIGLVFFVVVVILFLGSKSTPRACSICGQTLKRNSYRWKLGGKTQVLCPKCNSRMENKVSKESFNRATR